MTRAALELLRPVLLRPLPVLGLVVAAVLWLALPQIHRLWSEVTGTAAHPISWTELIPTGEAQAGALSGVVTHAMLDPTLAALTPDQAKASQSRFGGFVSRLDRQRVEITGYVVPLEFEGDRIVIFLLVPYAGACIHVPPPPPNQIIYVVARDGIDLLGDMYTPVSVTGTMAVSRIATPYAEVGYQLSAETVVMD